MYCLRIKKTNQITIINDDVLNINEKFLFDEKVIVFGNLPYNIQGDGIGIFYGYGVSYDTLICE